LKVDGGAIANQFLMQFQGRFTPRMPAERSFALYAGWRRAVEWARAWEQA